MVFLAKKCPHPVFPLEGVGGGKKIDPSF